MLFGMDSGIIGGVLTLPAFKEYETNLPLSSSDQQADKRRSTATTVSPASTPSRSPTSKPT